MYRIKINKETLKNHFQYDIWKYGLGIVLTILLWSLLVTMTEPQTPADKKVDIYLVGGYMLDEGVNEVEGSILADFPELMEVNIFNITVEGDMEFAGRQKLSVMIGSQSGDIYSFNNEEFKSWAKMGAFIPLDEYEDITKHFTQEEMDKYTFAAEGDPTPRLYGVPIANVKLINSKIYPTENAVMGVMAYSKNTEKAVKVLEWLLEKGSQ